MVGGEFGPESGVLLLQSIEIIIIKINSSFNSYLMYLETNYYLDFKKLL